MTSRRQKAVVTTNIQSRSNLSNDSILGQPATDKAYSSFRSNAWSPSVPFSVAQSINNDNPSKQAFCFTYPQNSQNSNYAAEICVGSTGISLSTNQEERMFVSALNGSIQLNNDVNLTHSSLSPSLTTQLQFSELSSNGSNYVSFQAPNALTNTTNYVLPDSDGNANDVLQTNGSGILSWAPQGSSGSGSFADNVFNIYDDSNINSKMFFNVDALNGITSTYSISNMDSGYLLGSNTFGDMVSGSNSYNFNYVNPIPFAGANTFLGTNNTGFLNTEGFRNTIVGSGSFSANTTGYYNTSLGAYCLQNNTSGAANVAIGTEVLENNTTGQGNIAIGLRSLHQNTVGSINLGIGAFTLSNTINSTFNVAIGHYALNQNNIGNENVAVGVNSFEDNTSGNFNSGIGSGSGTNNSTGSLNTYVGYNSGFYNSIGDENTSIGAYSLQQNKTTLGLGGNRNTALGSGALRNANFVNDCIAIGYHSLYNSFGPGEHNIAIGAMAIGNKTSFIGERNVAIGLNAGYEGNFVASDNVMIGANAAKSLYNGSKNVCLGLNSLGGLHVNDMVSNELVAIGSESMSLNESGSQQVAVGTRSLANTVNNLNNTAIGYEALYNCIADNNTCVGNQSGLNITQGLRNVCVGDSAGSNITLGSDSIVIGSGAQVANPNGVELVFGNDNLESSIISNEVNISSRVASIKIGSNVYKFLLA